MNRDVVDLWAWYTSVKKDEVGLLQVLEGRLQGETRPELRMELYSLIGVEYARLDDVVGHITAHERAVNEFPFDPLVRVSLATACSYFSYDVPRSIRVMDEAIMLARNANRFRRQILHSKARLLRDIGDFGALEKCLLEIISEPSSEGADVAKEDDFVSDLPAGTVSDVTIEKYKKYMRD